MSRKPGPLSRSVLQLAGWEKFSEHGLECRRNILLNVGMYYVYRQESGRVLDAKVVERLAEHGKRYRPREELELLAPTEGGAVHPLHEEGSTTTPPHDHGVCMMSFLFYKNCFQFLQGGHQTFGVVAYAGNRTMRNVILIYANT